MQVRPVGVVEQLVVVIEQTERAPDPLVGGRCHPEFLRKTLGAIANLVTLVRSVAGVADIAVIGRGVIDAAIAFIIRQIQADIRISGVVRNLRGAMLQERSGIDQIKRTEPPVYRQGGQADFVTQRVVVELGDFQVAHIGLEVEDPVGIEFLTKMHQVDGPIVSHVPGQRQTPTTIGRVVVVLLDELVVVDDLARRRPIQAACAVGNDCSRRRLTRLDRAHDEQRIPGRQLARHADIAIERHLESARDIVDIAALPVGVDHRAYRQLVLDDRDVDEGIAGDAFLALLGESVARVEPGMDFGRVRLVGDIAHRAAHRTGTEQGALRTGQNFDALKVDRVEVEVAAHQRGRRIVHIKRDGWLRPGRAGNLETRRVGREAADEDRRGTRPARRGTHIGQILDQLVEFGDVQVGQRIAAQRLDRQGNPVERFFAPGCGHDNVGDAAVICFRSSVGFLRQRRRSASAQQGHSDQRGRQFPAGLQVPYSPEIALIFEGFYDF